MVRAALSGGKWRRKSKNSEVGVEKKAQAEEKHARRNSSPANGGSVKKPEREMDPQFNRKVSFIEAEQKGGVEHGAGLLKDQGRRSKERGGGLSRLCSDQKFARG